MAMVAVTIKGKYELDYCTLSILYDSVRFLYLYVLEFQELSLDN